MLWFFGINSSFGTDFVDILNGFFFFINAVLYNDQKRIAIAALNYELQKMTYHSSLQCDINNQTLFLIQGSQPTMIE